MFRARRLIAGFTVVLVSYWAYLLLAVPLIEPPAKGRADFDGPLPPSENDAVQDLVKLFPAGAWQTQNPAVLENGQSLVLFRRYVNQGNGRIEIYPCTVIYTPSGPPPADDAERLRRKIILDTVDPGGGAILQFDKPVDFGHGDLGRLQGGQLIGNVIIRSEGKSPGPEDDLWLSTQNVNFNERRIWTDAGVEFRYGASNGRGREMEIGLSEPDQSQRGRRGGTVMGDLETFDLKHVEYLHLEPQPRSPGSRPRNTMGLSGPPQQDLPIEVTCQGPFHFDLPKRAATFHDRVDVFRLHPNGPSDHLSGELLTIFFQPKHAPSKPKPRRRPGEKPEKVGLADLEARSMEAEGRPVTMEAPLERVHARGTRLAYDVITGHVALDGEEEATLVQETNEIHAPNMQYDPAPDGRLGKVDAAGPGWFRGQMSGQGGRPLEARWSQRLDVRPKDQYQIVSLYGNAALFAAETGQLEAQEIHFWLIEAAPGTPSTQQRFQPDRLLADRGVVLKSSQMTANVEHMEVSFEAPLPPPSAAVRRFEAPQRPVAPGVANSANPLPPVGAIPGPRGESFVAGAPPPVAAGPNPAASFSANGNQASLGPSTAADQRQGARVESPADSVAPTAGGAFPAQDHFDVQGRVLWARMLLHGQQQAEIKKLIIEENVRFEQVASAQPQEKPVVVTGDRIEAVNPSQTQGEVLVLGRPARFESSQLTLSGTNLNLDRGSNRMWVDGPGVMELPMDRLPDAFPTGPLGGPGPAAVAAKRSPSNGPAGTLEIRWQQGMVFNGRVATFQNQVNAIAPQRHLVTDRLEVQFKQPIVFGQSASRQQAEMERVTCSGGVWMKALTLETPPADAGQHGIPPAARPEGVPASAAPEGFPAAAGQEGSLPASGQEGLSPASGPDGTSPNVGQNPARLAAQEEVQMVDFTLDVLTGAFSGHGPGSIVYVTHGAANAPGGGPPGQMFPFSRPPAAASAAARNKAAAAGGPPRPDTLTGLRVIFQGMTKGNMQLRNATFQDRVKTAYAPVPTWQASLDPDRPELLGPQGTSMVSDRLSILQFPTPLEGKWAMEMTAVGNVRLESVIFSAICSSLKYSEAGDRMIFEGDGHTDARFWHYPNGDTPADERSFNGQWIEYHPSTRQVIANGFRGAEMR